MKHRRRLFTHGGAGSASDESQGMGLWENLRQDSALRGPGVDPVPVRQAGLLCDGAERDLRQPRQQADPQRLLLRRLRQQPPLGSGFRRGPELGLGNLNASSAVFRRARRWVPHRSFVRDQ